MFTMTIIRLETVIVVCVANQSDDNFRFENLIEKKFQVKLTTKLQ